MPITGVLNVSKPKSKRIYATPNPQIGSKTKIWKSAPVKFLIPKTGRNTNETINLKNFFTGLSLKCFTYERLRAELIIVIKNEMTPTITIPIKI